MQWPHTGRVYAELWAEVHHWHKKKTVFHSKENEDINCRWTCTSLSFQTCKCLSFPCRWTAATFLLSRVTELDVLHSQHMTHLYGPSDVSLQREQPQKTSESFDEGRGLVLHPCSVGYLTAPPYLSVWMAHPSHRPSVSLLESPWSSNPAAGRPQNWSRHSGCDSVTWDA